MDLKELLSNQEFNEKLSGVKNLTEAIDLLSEYGVEVSEEELESAIKSAEDSSDELEEDALEAVAGGVYLSPVIAALLILAGIRARKK